MDFAEWHPFRWLLCSPLQNIYALTIADEQSFAALYMA